MATALSFSSFLGEAHGCFLETVSSSLAEESASTEKCMYCNSTKLADLDSESVCLSCNRSQMYDALYQPSWSKDTLSTETVRSSSTRNDLLPESSMSTTIMSSGWSKLNNDLRRLMTWNSTPHNERALRLKIDDIATTCKKHKVPHSVIDNAQRLYHIMVEKIKTSKLVKRKRGNNDKGLKATAVFQSLKKYKRPKTYQEVAAMFDISPSYVSQGISLYKQLMCDKEDVEDKAELVNDFVAEYGCNLDMTDKHVERVQQVCSKAHELGIIENNTPLSVVAGCIYYVAIEFGLSLSSSQISTTCGVSVPTINKVWERLNKRSIDLL